MNLGCVIHKQKETKQFLFSRVYESNLEGDLIIIAKWFSFIYIALDPLGFKTRYSSQLALNKIRFS